jgi:catecholate siderophore receptor
LRDTPQSIDVVTRKAMDEQGITTLENALNNVTGISMGAGEGGVPSGDNTFIRGFSARTDIFRDGVRDFGGFFRDTFNTDAVEVLKGPSSMIFGRGSTGGVINQVSKTPLLDSFTSGTVGLGTDATRRVTADGNYIVDQTTGTAFRINAMAHHNEVADRDVVENNRFGLAPSITWGIGMPTEITLSYLHQSDSNIPDYGHPYASGGPIPVKRSNFYGLANFDYEHTNANILTAKVKHEFSDSLTLQNTTRYGRVDRDSMQTPPRTPNFNTATVSRSRNARLSEDTFLVNQTDLTTKFQTGFIDHTLVTGLDLTRETSNLTARTITGATAANLWNPDPYSGSGGNVTYGAHTEVIANSVGVYAIDTLKLSPQWEVTGGLRFDRFEADSEVSGGNQLSRTDQKPSYRGGVVYKPIEPVSVYVSYGTSFNPSAEQLTLASTATSTNSSNIGPEENETYEIGSKWDVSRRLSLRTALFRINKTNARTEDPNSTTDFIVLEGKQRVQGIELQATGQITDKWQVIAGYTYMSSEVLSSRNAGEVGKSVQQVPEQTAVLWTTYNVDKDWQVGGGVRFVDQRYNNNANANLVPGYALLDATVGYRLTENVDFRLNGYNLTDEEYYGRVGGGHAVPGAGRSAVLTTAFKF